MKKLIPIIFLIPIIHTTAYAFTISTVIADGCHEKLATSALREVRKDFTTAGQLSTTDDQKALVDDVEFKPDEDMKDLGGITFLLSIRDNDLKGRGANDLSQLALVHGNPEFQEEHCLRTATQDEPDGSKEALSACRSFIRKRVEQALDGLDSSGKPDINNTTVLPVHLSLRGDVDVPLPTYYVRMGQAIHTIQDSFTHTYRTPDGMKVTVVLNWIEFVNGNLLESRDGPAHAKALDVCDDPDDVRKTRRLLATQASVDVLKATLDPQMTKEQKMTAVSTVLDTYLTYEPGCNFENNWCNAHERQYKDANGTFPGCQTNGSGILIGVLLILGSLLFRSQRIKVGKWTAVIFIFGFLMLFIGNAKAQDKEPNPTAPAPNVTPVAEAGPTDRSEGAWGVYTGLSGSLDHPAFAGAVGVRRKMSTHWTLGWDAELNPWVAINGSSPVRLAVFNTYGTVICRFPLSYENFNLRTTLNVGTSTMLINLYGADRGTTGVYGGFSPLGLEWKASKSYYIIFNPLSYAIPIPQLTGVPLTYPQYRVTIGLEWLGS
jgi:hypothetical protein